MAANYIAITEGDTLTWNFTLKDENGSAVDLTGATVTLSMRLRGSTTNKIDGGSVTVVSASGGTCKYDPIAGDVDTPGQYDLELKIVDTNSDIQHNYQLVPVTIRAAIKA